MPGRLRLLVASLALLALALLAVPPLWWQPFEAWLPATVVLALAGLGMEFVDVPTARHGRLSVSGVAHGAIILIAPAPWAALAVGAAILAHQLITRAPIPKTVFNVANHVVTVSLASLAVGLMGSPGELMTARAIPLGYLTAALAALTYYTVNVTLAAVAVSLATGRRFGYILRLNNRGTVLPDLGAATLGVFLAATWYNAAPWVALLAVPTAVIALSLRVIRRLERETVEAIETLADSIDDRDPTTFHHSERVAQYAVALAEAMTLPEELVDLIGSAARVHDLGKMGVTDAVLMKPGPLEEAELRKMREHPVIGARILDRYQLYREGVGLVRAHHERWDGQGYPDGLAGERIPLGARVIAVADAFDAMTSDRPYRAGVHPLEALEDLRTGAGTQWDPVVAAHFLRLLSDPATVLPDTPALRSLRQPRVLAPPSGQEAGREGAQPVRAPLALAVEEAS